MLEAPPAAAPALGSTPPPSEQQFGLVFPLTRWSVGGINVGLSGGKGRRRGRTARHAQLPARPQGHGCRCRRGSVRPSPTACWLTIGQDGCLYVFPRAEWQRRSDEVASSPLSDADGRAYSRLFFGSSDEAKLDSQGRVTIPQRLREAVGIQKDVVVLGVRDRMEIWDRESYERLRASFAAPIRTGRSIPGGSVPMATFPEQARHRSAAEPVADRHDGR